MHQLRSFDYLFRHVLAPGGTFIGAVWTVDIYTSILNDAGGGFSCQGVSILITIRQYVHMFSLGVGVSVWSCLRSLLAMRAELAGDGGGDVGGGDVGGGDVGGGGGSWAF